MYFLITSYVRDKAVYCCWVSVYALINYVIVFIYLSIFISTSGGAPGYRETPVLVDIGYTDYVLRAHSVTALVLNCRISWYIYLLSR
jgi:hypothetical protein